MKTKKKNGLRTEIPEGMKLTKFAKRILKRLEKKGFALWQQDSSEFVTITQLLEIANNVGYRVIEMRSNEIREADKVSAEGQFLILNENCKEVKQHKD